METRRLDPWYGNRAQARELLHIGFDGSMTEDERREEIQRKARDRFGMAVEVEFVYSPKDPKFLCRVTLSPIGRVSPLPRAVARFADGR